MVNQELSNNTKELKKINDDSTSLPTEATATENQTITEPQPIWDIDAVETKLIKAYENNSETELLAILKDNSFLFYDLFTRKGGIQPIFRELNFGGDFRCDFAWLNDNSSGPEWVLVEVEKPKMVLFRSDGKPTAPFQGAIEQIKTWDQHFQQNSGEAKRIFGAVAKFRLILVTGTTDEWKTEHAQKWRMYHHKNSSIEIRSMGTFFNSLKMVKANPEDFWSFEENPITLSHSELKEYWQNYEYMDRWRKVID